MRNGGAPGWEAEARRQERCTRAARETTVDFCGLNLGTKFGAEDAPFVVTQSLKGAEIAVTEVRVDLPLGRLSAFQDGWKALDRPGLLHPSKGVRHGSIVVSAGLAASRYAPGYQAGRASMREVDHGDE
jgi:hypothetical protein